MKRYRSPSLLAIAVVLLSVSMLRAQVTGSITSTQCVRINVGDQTSTIGIQVTGTWTGTLQPEISIQGQTPANVQVTPSTSSTAQSTITANGVYQAKIAGGSSFLVCGATVGSGTANVFLNSSQGVAVIIPPPAATGVTSFNTRTGAVTAQSGDYTWDQIGAGSNLNAQTMGTGGSFSPLNFGRVVSSGMSWLQYVTDPVPSVPGALLATAHGAGSLIASHIINAEFTLVSSVGELTPSGAFGTQCPVGANDCVATVTAPPQCTTPPVGYTGCTYYARDVTNAQTMQQVAGCINTTAATCVFGSIPTTTAPPTTNPVVPLPALAKTSVCPPNVTPVWWLPDAAGNLNSQAYISEYYANPNGGGTGGPQTAAGAGVFTECRPHWFTNQRIDPPGGKNAAVVIDWVSGPGSNSPFNTAGNQERALWVNHTTVSGDTSTHFSLTGIQSEVDLAATGAGFTVGTGIDSEIAAFSGQIGDTAASSFTANGYGPQVARFQYFKNGAGASSNGVYTVTNSIFTVGNASGFVGGTAVSIYNANCNNTTGGVVTNVACTGLFFPTPSATAARFGNGIRALAIPSAAGFSPNNTSGTTSDYVIRNDVPGMVTSLNGPVYATSLTNNALSAFTGNLSANLSGAVKISQLSAPSTFVSATCSGGASTYQYKIVYKDVNGGAIASGVLSTGANCTNPLTSGNPVTLNNTGVALNKPFGFVSGDVYRTSGPMTTGKIGTITCSSLMFTVGCSDFSDTGLAGDGATEPSANTTGGMVAYNYGTLTNCAAVGTAASPSVASCGAASAGSFSCATNATGATCTVNTTAVTANSQIFVQEDETLGTRLGVTCNTSTNVLPASRLLNARSANTSFTINLGTVTTDPACFGYFIVN